MDKRHRVFIYDRKEIGVLVLLGVMVALFAFTLGVHFGKKVGGQLTVDDDGNVVSVESAKDLTPTRQEFSEQIKQVDGAVEDTLNQTLHQEVAKTGIKLDKGHQVILPVEPSDEEAGATDLKKRDVNVSGEPVQVSSDQGEGSDASKVIDPAKEHQDVEAGGLKIAEKLKKLEAMVKEAGKDLERVESRKVGRVSKPFTIQVGSFPSVQEADSRKAALEALGVTSYVHKVNLQEKGTWYRIYLGSYDSKQEARRAGNEFRKKHVIDTFIVATTPKGVSKK